MKFLLSRYDPILAEHVRAYKKPKKECKFIICQQEYKTGLLIFAFVQNMITEEVKRAKYFSIIADSTPNSSNNEHITLIIRYVKFGKIEFLVEELFICFNNLNDKTGQEISDLLLNFLQQFKLNFKNCAGQDYDNGANMAGKYNGLQAVLLREDRNCTFYDCGNHILNLVRVNSAEI